MKLVSLEAVVLSLCLSVGAAAQEGWRSLVSESVSGFDVEGAEKVSSEKARELMEDGAIFVDVRRSVQYSLAHIPGAVNLDVNSALTEQSLSDYAVKDQTVVFYCSDTACDRSARASAMAVSWGYERVVYFADGWSAWIAEDYPRN